MRIGMRILLHLLLLAALLGGAFPANARTMTCAYCRSGVMHGCAADHVRPDAPATVDCCSGSSVFPGLLAAGALRDDAPPCNCALRSEPAARGADRLLGSGKPLSPAISVLDVRIGNDWLRTPWFGRPLAVGPAPAPLFLRHRSLRL